MNEVHDPSGTVIRDSDLSIRGLLLMLAITTLGAALQYGGGTLSTMAILGLTAVIAEAAFSLVAPERRSTLSPEMLVITCVAVACCVHFLGVPPGMSENGSRGYLALTGFTAMLAAIACVVRPRHRALAISACVVLSAVLAVWILSNTPHPRIDVLMFQRDASAALLRGVSPYSIRFPDPYPAAVSRLFYGAGVSVDGVLQFGYPYMPLTLLFAIPGYLLGDPRYASVAALTLAALLIAGARPSRHATIAAALFVITPAMPLMVIGAWNDSYVVLLMALAWYCQCRSPAALPYVIGLLLVSKQYLVVVAPLVLLLVPLPWTLGRIWAFAWRALLAGSLVTLPFLLWDARGFIDSVVLLQFGQPFRADALSYLAWANPASPARWLAIPFALALISCLVFLRLSRKRPVGFAGAVGVTMLLFFAFNKQAFLNYYFMTLGCLACALAACELPPAAVHTEPAAPRSSLGGAT